MDGTQMQLEDWLDDLCVRFIINLPHEDLSSVARICFQVEEAQWFYEDFIRPLDPTLPSMSLRIFCLRIFQHCPLLATFSAEHHTKAFEEFLQYKMRVPVRGAIMLNQAMDSVVLVKGWKKGASWSFPRGKINKDEDDLDCAIREVYEETGLDLRAAGLAPSEKKPKCIEIPMREQQLRLYILRDIPMDTDFQPRTRKEISKIQWYKLSDLPAFRKKGDKGAQNRNDAGAHGSKFYMVAPFLVPLKKWIASQKKMEEKRAVAGGTQAGNTHRLVAPDRVPNTEDDMWAPVLTTGPGSVTEALDGTKSGAEPSFATQLDARSLPASSHEDKGSALLSILQAGQAGSQRGTLHVPQTPLDLNFSDPPPPWNPHHHSNRHQARPDAHANEPPPVFQLAAKPPGHPSALSARQAVGPRSTSENAAAMAQRLYGADEAASLAYTQLLPRQGQGALHGQPQAHQTGPIQPLRGIASYHDQVVQGPPPLQLNGHSMALLNVLKRDASPTTNSAQDANGGQNRWPNSDHLEAPNLSPYTSHAPPPQLPRLLEHPARHVSLPQALLERARPDASVASDNHRSALLEMFKKAEPDGASGEAQGRSQRSATSSVRAGEGVVMEAMPQSAHDGRHAEARAASLDQASVQHGNHGWENRAPPSRTRGQAPPQLQPTRILQRGQTMRDDGGGPQVQGQVAGVDANATPSTGELGRRAGGSDEQKRRLLSLFSKQQGPSTEEAEASKQRAASATCGNGEATSWTWSRRGTETPMSPAEQSFLLEYLQTVTNSASR